MWGKIALSLLPRYSTPYNKLVLIVLFPSILVPLDRGKYRVYGMHHLYPWRTADHTLTFQLNLQPKTCPIRLQCPNKITWITQFYSPIRIRFLTLMHQEMRVSPATQASALWGRFYCRIHPMIRSRLRLPFLCRVPLTCLLTEFWCLAQLKYSNELMKHLHPKGCSYKGWLHRAGSTYAVVRRELARAEHREAILWAVQNKLPYLLAQQYGVRIAEYRGFYAISFGRGELLNKMLLPTILRQVSAMIFDDFKETHILLKIC